MAPKERTFAELGFAADRDGSYRAEFSIREGQQIRHIRGPGRSNKQRALGDLNIIRAAAPEGASRADGFQAMEAAAKRLKDVAAAEAGGLEKVGDEHRARVQYLTTSGLTGTIRLRGVKPFARGCLKNVFLSKFKTHRWVLFELLREP